MRTVLTTPILLVLFCFPFFTPDGFHAAASLAKTPPDQEGPFYPLVRQEDEDNDLIRVAGRPERASGDILHLSGTVRATDGAPLSGAVVEIWQTDLHGRYKDERDRSPGPRDRNFQYWGKTTTGEDGSYSFITLVPGGYHPRPPHIHFKVWIDGSARLTSQIYFANHPEAGKMNIRFRTSKPLTVELQSVQPGEYKAVFDIIL
jgi:protocatechuate 3,4-dioxygenase, beta subunit